MILILCPMLSMKSAGIRMLYHQVEILNRAGMPAAILFTQVGPDLPDMPAVPVRYAEIAGSVGTDDILVIPEGMTDVMWAMRTTQLRRFVIALNWQYIYSMLPNRLDWRVLGIERVLTHSQHIADYMQWAVRLPTHVFVWGIRSDLYYHEPAAKVAQVVFIKRKGQDAAGLMRLLWSRNHDFLEKIRWIELDDLPEIQYAAEIRRTQVFVNVSYAEGLPCSLLEAMRAGTIVAGYNSVGGKHDLVGSGEQRNCILAENLDYPDLARQMEPLLLDVLAGDLSQWEPLRQNGFATSAAYTREAEEASIVEMWRGILGK